MTTPVENLPLLTTIKVAGEVMGLTDDQTRGLLRERRLAGAKHQAKVKAKKNAKAIA